MKIIAQQSVIEDILDALSTSIYGMGISMKCDVTSKLDGDRSYIEFVSKDGYTIKPGEWFWLGYNIR